MKQAARLATLAACTALASPVLAESTAAAESVDATEPETLASLIRELGYRASVEKDNAGDPMIRSSAGGVDFQIYFFGCEGGERCRSLLFQAGYNLESGTTVDVVEAWNEDVLFGRAYLDDEADPWVEMPVNLFGGVNRENFADTFDWWETVIGDFQRHIGFE
jgi:Putative bacterial sensory transduction regulator